MDRVPMHKTRIALVSSILALAAAESRALPLQMTGTLSILQPVPIIGVGVVPVAFAQNPDPLVVSVTGGAFGLPAGLFSGTFIAPTPPLTGGISPSAGLESVVVSGGAGTFVPAGGPGGGFGGTQAVGGQAVIEFLGGLINLTIPLQLAGVGGTQPGGAGALALTVTGGGWTTGPAVLTGISSAIVSTVNGAIGPQLIVGNLQTLTTTFFILHDTANVLSAVNTVSLSGSDARSAGGLGTLTLVTPIRVLTNAAGNFPMFAVQTLEFTPVPEPGTALLLASGLACLGIGARRRRRARRSPPPAN